MKSINDVSIRSFNNSNNRIYINYKFLTLLVIIRDSNMYDLYRWIQGDDILFEVDENDRCIIDGVDQIDT
jgi:hypothetical protein